MKINGAYKFRTKANVFPSLKICFLGQYQDRVSGDTNFSFFIATPDNEVEEVVIENPYSGDFFIPKVEEVYLQNVGNKKTDWVATFKCTWDTSLNAQEGDLKILLGYKAGETVIDEKPKEYIAVETDPKYLVNTIAQRKHGTLHAIGGGFFTGNKPDEWYKYRRTSSFVSHNDEITETGSRSSRTVYSDAHNRTRTGLSNAIHTSRTYPFYYYTSEGLVEEGVKPDYSRSSTSSIVINDNDANGNGTYVQNYSVSSSNHIGGSYFSQTLNPGEETIDYFFVYDRYNPPFGFLKNKFWLTPSVFVMSDFTASGNALGSFASQDFYNMSGSIAGTETRSANWNIENYSSFLTRNLTDSFLFKNEESVTFSDARNDTYNTTSKLIETTGSTSVTRTYKTSVYLTSLSSGDKQFLCDFDTTNTTNNDQFGRIVTFWGRYINKALYNWDAYQVPENSNNGFYNYYDIKNISYAHKCIKNYGRTMVIVEDETPVNIFMKAVSHRGKSTLRGDYLYYVESDVTNLLGGEGGYASYVESDAFTPNINGFLTKEFTLSVLVFNIKDIENYEKKEVKFKPSKLPEGMENLTISKILAIQYIE